MTLASTHHEIDDLGGGQFRHTQYVKRIAYQDSGSLYQIVNDWSDSGIPARPHHVVSAPFFVTVGSDGLRRIHPTREIDRYIEVGAPYIKVGGVWQQVSLGAPVRTGNQLQWTTVNANVYIQMCGHFVKLGILLKGGWTPSDDQFAFPVGLNGLTRSGNTLLADGVPVMSFGAPVVYDNDNQTDVRQISSQFEQVLGQWYAVFTLPDLSGMSSPLIDPTLELQPDATDGLDTFLQSAGPTNNFGTHIRLFIGESNAEVSIYRELIEFDLSTLPAGANISSTTLSIMLVVDRSSNARTFRVYRLKREWVEAQATWNIYSTGNSWQTAGGFGVNDSEQTDIGSRAFTATESTEVFKDFSITAVSKNDLDWGLEQGGAQTGWLIKADTELNDAYQFYSSDDAASAKRPKLVIVYTEGAVTQAMHQYRQRRVA